MPETYKFYLDQMFSVEVAQTLSKEGYDVVRASDTGLARADDREILQKAISENRILITLDEHFGDWVILPLSRHPGVIRLKVHPDNFRERFENTGPFPEPSFPGAIERSSCDPFRETCQMDTNRIRRDLL
jgi:predicted nuclease of predicted toxin-antitoxin system